MEKKKKGAIIAVIGIIFFLIAIYISCLRVAYYNVISSVFFVLGGTFFLTGIHIVSKSGNK